jgi:uncharacterized protein
MPAFALFFPVHVAVAATAVVHGANNIFKILVVGRNADRDLVLRFGIPAIMAAFVGAAVLGYVSGFGELLRYSIGLKTAVITPIKLVMGILMFVFAMFELLPALKNLRFDRKYLFYRRPAVRIFRWVVRPPGSASICFPGQNRCDHSGICRHQCRYCIYGGYGPNRHLCRVYFFSQKTASPIGLEQLPLIIAGIMAAFAGVMIGKRWMHKVTMNAIQWLTGFLLLAIALALGAGII